MNLDTAVNHVSTVSRTAIAVVLLLSLFATRALAQTDDDRRGFAVREVSLSTGYAFVQLPPVTLGGFLPGDVLNEDLITSAAAAIEWRRVTPRTQYRLDLFGAYTARSRYWQLSAPASDFRFGVLRTLGARWRLRTGVTNLITSSDQLAVQPTPSRRLVDDAASFDALAGTVALARSPHPDPTQAALFVPISQSFVGADLYGLRLMASNVQAEATRSHSERFASYVRGGFTNIKRISANRGSEQVLAFPDSRAGTAGVGVRYDRSERTQLTASFDWAQSTGLFEDTALIAAAGYGWTGRKWFTVNTVGVALRPFDTSSADALSRKAPSQAPAVIYRGAVGYKFQTQTLLAQYSREPHDAYGFGGSNTVTGFQGDVQSLGGSWSWSPSHRWMAQSDVSLIRRPGNFSHIYAWLATASLGRQLGQNVRFEGEYAFDRHGGRGFEGFHLTRHGPRVNVIWAPSRRRPASSQSSR